VKPAEQLPEYVPAPLSEQVRELRGQLAKHVNQTDWYVKHGRMSEGYAAAELQRIQSALRSLEALLDLLGPDAKLTKDQLLQRLALREEKAA
jgi:hypothetical protein